MAGMGTDMDLSERGRRSGMTQGRLGAAARKTGGDAGLEENSGDSCQASRETGERPWEGDWIAQISDLPCSKLIGRLKKRMLEETRYVSIEQARITTRVSKDHLGKPRAIVRALCLAAALEQMSIRIDPEELIVGNRTAGVRAGVVSPDTGSAWVDRAFETLPTRAQDRFEVREADIRAFREDLLPYWRGRSLEDQVRSSLGDAIDEIAQVVKINQTDHSQGHICPNVQKWLTQGPSGLAREAEAMLARADGEARVFYESVAIAMRGARAFLLRYARLASDQGMKKVADNCAHLADHPAETFYQALQSTWFLFVILQMEGNASSFSPGRMDQYLYPYFEKSVGAGMTLPEALELTEALFLKFNQVVYLRNAQSARYFAGFPIGFNVAIGGQTEDGRDASNALSYLFLQAQAHLGLPQPNLSCRVFAGSPQALLEACSRVIGLGSGMPQLFNDEAVIPALVSHGVSRADAVNYAIVGCVELTTQGSSLGLSDAAMFNLVKVLELTLNDGIDMLSGKAIGLKLGTLADYARYEDLEDAYRRQIDAFMDKMVCCVNGVEELHAALLPTPFLSAVVDDCMARGQDVTQGGAHYNFAGVQAIQVANVADSLAAIKKLVYEEGQIAPEALLAALRSDFAGDALMRERLLNRAPKYGNDLMYVDEIGAKWATYFAERLEKYRNRRGGCYQMGLYTVSAHVPMGQNVAASADGRRAREPLADGGVSAMYGRDQSGPTALLHSVARLPFHLASNGALLNMKFLPQFFKTESGIRKFTDMIRAFSRLGISHVQFNVLREQDLIAAQRDPEKYRGLTVRVAGYTAYFTELAPDLQCEIIARTAYEGV
ncbi:MAG: formate C-acetyltransferase/glycerol dehydratase family glycyl radical enzyme [Clostridia bacterium]